MIREYDQAGLDAQYNLRERVLDFQDYLDRWAAESRRVRESLECRLDVAYGDAPGQTLDVFPATGTGAPVHVFIHGGYWRALDKEDFSFVAEPLVAAGAGVLVINYALAPSVRVGEIVRQVHEAIGWSHRHAAEFGGDGERLYVSGHSAGGHLTAMAMTHDWSGAAGVPADVIKGGCAISGLFDLEPLRRTYLNEDLQLDEASARENSPMQRIAAGAAPLVVAVGGVETDEFLRQSAEFAAAWEQKGNPCRQLEPAGLHHFSIMDPLTWGDGETCRAILQQMGLQAAR